MKQNPEDSTGGQPADLATTAKPAYVPRNPYPSNWTNVEEWMDEAGANVKRNPADPPLPGQAAPPVPQTAKGKGRTLARWLYKMLGAKASGFDPRDDDA